MHHTHDVRRAVVTADAFQRRRLHRLRIDAHARYRVLFHRSDLLRTHAVGTPCLHRELRNMRSIKRIIYHFEHFGKKIIRKTGRRSSADVNALHRKPQSTHILCRRIEVACEHIHKGAQLLLRGKQIRRKGAVEASRETEWNADVDAHGPRIPLREKRQLTHGNIRDEPCLTRTAIVVLAEACNDFLGAHAAAQPTMHDLRRTYPVEDAPRRGRHSEACAEECVDIPLDGAMNGGTRHFIRLAIRNKIKFFARAIVRKKKNLGHDRRRLTARLPVHHRQLGVIRLPCPPDDLHLEERQYLADNFDYDLGSAVDRKRPNLHDFFCFS